MPPPLLQARRRGAPKPRVVFPLIAQWHQALHSLPIAAALSRRGDYEVHVAAPGATLARAKTLMAALGGRGVVFHNLWTSSFLRENPPKALMLAAAATWLTDFAAVVAPERTSLMLKRFGVTRPLFIHSDHGAGDRAVGYEPRIRRFDGVLLAGAKQEARMLRAGLIIPGRYAIVGYPKFEAAAASRQAGPPLFRNPRPTVLYNPHFRADLSSWPAFGATVLEGFAAQDRYNLIFAPHVRMAAERAEELKAVAARYAGAANIHVDLGGPRCCDMTYTDMADAYLGDVSSQVYEFIRAPRPCLFLNASGVDRAGDENYAHWALGPVATTAEGITAAVDRARASHGDYRRVQAAAFRETFDLGERPCSERAADAVEAMMRDGAVVARPLGELSPTAD
ncbi:MAG: glycerophosphotransferase [Alphaproteobacteria bacterium]|nr:glycerophosphotransferase [Alphaproteobacteria bacterium]MBU1514992.1 glycerophosphotransferase [Alphaproteobacteria bacterium]MBU2095641.1 glycerophosphotransferase [Alphaproteobacteria bacterium]MBU2151055.1 glycerophosphotransferase [Alphaproteobacteria bacterium]MBU2306918.1 glycerophosphotransferase [Alphaproteobacteria bacterium]